MRTTLDIDEDVLAAAKAISRQQGISTGQAVSRLLRLALIGNSNRADETRNTVAGFRPFSSRGSVVSDELIDQLRDREGV